MRLVWQPLQAVLWIALLGFVVLLALSRVTPYEVLVVRSGSMEPSIHTGGIVIVDRQAQALKVGDVASFREPSGSVVTHRVVGMDDAGYITRGDANGADDATARPRAAVYGTVVLALPILGYGIHWLEQPAVFLVLLLGTGGFLIIDALRTIAREVARMRQAGRLPDGD
jgi:signal peptidase I